MGITATRRQMTSRKRRLHRSRHGHPLRTILKHSINSLMHFCAARYPAAARRLQAACKQNGAAANSTAARSSGRFAPHCTDSMKICHQRAAVSIMAGSCRRQPGRAKTWCGVGGIKKQKKKKSGAGVGLRDEPIAYPASCWRGAENNVVNMGSRRVLDVGAFLPSVGVSVCLRAILA